MVKLIPINDLNIKHPKFIGHNHIFNLTEGYSTLNLEVSPWREGMFKILVTLKFYVITYLYKLRKRSNNQFISIIRSNVCVKFVLYFVS